MPLSLPLQSKINIQCPSNRIGAAAPRPLAFRRLSPPGWVFGLGFQADVDLDTEGILDKLRQEPATQQAAMTIAQTLIAKGEARGEAKGLWIGRIIGLQELMGIEPGTLEGLSALPLAELERCHQELRRAYDVKFKGR